MFHPYFIVVDAIYLARLAPEAFLVFHETTHLTLQFFRYIVSLKPS